VLCDVDSLPDERFNALYTLKEYYCRENQQLVILLRENNISLFLRCIRCSRSKLVIEK
jgi:hypothetical protein